MDYTTVVQFINGVGFPIACCVALFYQNNKQAENHTKEMTELKTVIENNTLVLKELATKVDDMKEV
jgi:hypothetical protein